MKRSLLALLVAAACSQPAPPAAPQRVAEPPAPAPEAGAFEEVGAALGLRFTHDTRRIGAFDFPEMVGSGAALWDYDGDGNLDVYVVQGSVRESRRTTALAAQLRDRLFRNDAGRFADVTAAAGIRAPGDGMGVAVGDIDNDGHPDLFVAQVGHNALWRNRGDGTFEDATARLGALNPRWSTSAAFVDVDRDGWLNLYVTNYVVYTDATRRTCRSRTGRPDYCGPQGYRGARDRLLRNVAGTRFEDVSSAAGVDSEPSSGLGVVTADFDDDGWPDIYVANDLRPNLLWRNQRDGTFRNQALLRGCAVNRDGRPEASMGVVAGDLDGDGDEDLFLTHLRGESNTLYVNDGRGFFEDRSFPSGLGAASMPYTGFGTALLDYDNDGWLDLFAANGAVFTIDAQARAGDPLPFRQPNQLYRNLGGGRFEDTSASVPALAAQHVSRGVAVGDLDDDGDADLVVVNNNGPLRVLRNRVGSQAHWVGLRLRTSGRDALGAKVTVVQGDERRVRRVRGDGSYLSANDARLLVGLRSSDPVEVQVRWPDGRQERFPGLPARRYHTLTQAAP